MIFLLNKEYVVWEVVELARLQMCEVLRVPTMAIEAKIDLAGDKLHPEFNVDAGQCKGVGVDQIRDVLSDVYAQCKDEMAVRLRGVTQTRDDVLRELRREPKADTSQT